MDALAGLLCTIAWLRPRHVFTSLLLVSALNAFAVETISVTVESLTSASVQAKNLTLAIDLTAQPTAKLSADYQLDKQPEWASAALDCQLPNNIKQWHCDKGKLQSNAYTIPFALDLGMQLNQSEFGGLHGRLALLDVAFSDKEGLHAAEGVNATLDFDLTRAGEAWHLQPTLRWNTGAVYWDPYYLEGTGHQLQGDFFITDEMVRFDHLSVQLNKVGTLNIEGSYGLNPPQLLSMQANLPDLDLSTAFPLLFKPLLQHSILQQTDLTGRIALSATVERSELRAFDLRVHDVSVIDKQQHFSFEHINAHIPWDFDAKKTVELSYQQGQVRSLPLGEAHIALAVNRYAWTAPQITLPILDGALVLNGLSAARLGGRWYWHLGADVQNLGMPQLSQAFGWPTMQGNASVHIPLVTYSNASLQTDGEIVFDVFDGQATVSNLALKNPLGNVPHLSADVNMRALDLGQLTKTFSFGSIEGKLDGEVNGLELLNWQPIAFDARFISSPGRYRKKISQRAVENISALGGAGAVAAIQRSVLRFFEAFNYDKIGLSCRLARDVCAMDGLPESQAKSTEAGYLIVKGKGIPAISVKGFNKVVGWEDLLSRIQRITNENTEAVVR